jgi:hypothetical protein
MSQLACEIIHDIVRPDSLAKSFLFVLLVRSRPVPVNARSNYPLKSRAGPDIIGTTPLLGSSLSGQRSIRPKCVCPDGMAVRALIKLNRFC